MYQAMDAAGKECKCCFGGCMSEIGFESALNKTFCPEINQRLLNPAGYSCYAWRWTNNGREGSSSMGIVIKTWKSGDSTDCVSIGARAAYAIEHGELPQARGIVIKTGDSTDCVAIGARAAYAIEHGELPQARLVQGNVGMNMRAPAGSCSVPYSDLKVAARDGPLLDANFRCRACGQVVGHHGSDAKGAPQPQFAQPQFAQPPSAPQMNF
jgi:hypothetical protein